MQEQRRRLMERRGAQLGKCQRGVRHSKMGLAGGNPGGPRQPHHGPGGAICC